MASKSTVAIDESLRKTIKKIAALLDIPQGEVIKKAIGDLEQKILSESLQTDSIDLSTENRIKQELHHYTEMVWEMESESKKISTKINGWHRIH